MLAPKPAEPRARGRTATGGPTSGLACAVDLAQRCATVMQALVARGDLLLHGREAGLPLRPAFGYRTVLDHHCPP